MLPALAVTMGGDAERAVPREWPATLQADTSFPAIIEAFNQLTGWLTNTVSQLEGQHLEQREEISVVTSQMDSFQANQERRFGEVRTEICTAGEALEARIEDRLKGVDGELHQAITTLQDSTANHTKALELSILEVANAHTNTASLSLPRMRAEVDGEIRRISSALATQREEQEGRAQAYDARISQQAADLTNCRTELQQHIASEVEVLRAGLNAVEERCESLSAASMQGSLSVAQLKEDVEVQFMKLEAAIKSEGASTSECVLAAVRSHEGERLDALEAVVKQAEFERLRSMEKGMEKVTRLRTDLEANCEFARQLEGTVSKQKAELEIVQESLQRSLASEVSQLRAQLAHDAEYVTSMTVAGKAAETRLGNEIVALRERFDPRLSKLETQAKAEADEVLRIIRADEGVRLATLEESYRSVKDDRRTLVEQHKQEVDSIRLEIVASCKAVDEKHQAVDAQASKELQLTQHTMHGLVQKLEDLAHAQVACNENASQCQKLVHALETRLYPWRSTSPGRASSRTQGSSNTPRSRLNLSAATRTQATTSPIFGAGARPDDAADDLDCNIMRINSMNRIRFEKRDFRAQLLVPIEYKPSPFDSSSAGEPMNEFSKPQLVAPMIRDVADILNLYGYGVHAEIVHCRDMSKSPTDSKKKAWWDQLARSQAKLILVELVALGISEDRLRVKVKDCHSDSFYIDFHVAIELAGYTGPVQNTTGECSQAAPANKPAPPATPRVVVAGTGYKAAVAERSTQNSLR